MTIEQSGFGRIVQTHFSNTKALERFTQIAGAGSLLYVSYRDFKLMILGAKAGPGTYDEDGTFVAEERSSWGKTTLSDIAGSPFGCVPA